VADLRTGGHFTRILQIKLSGRERQGQLREQEIKGGVIKRRGELLS